MDVDASANPLHRQLLDTVEAKKKLEDELGELRRANDALGERAERFRLLAAHIDEAFWLISPDEQELYYVSPAYEAIIGRSDESIHADPSSWVESLHAEDRERVLAARKKRGPGPHQDERDDEYRIVHPDGSLRWVWMRSVPVYDLEGALVARAGVALDITKRKMAEEALRSAALQDKLTRLPNRLLLTERLTELIRRSKEEPDYRFGVLFLDFDRFKVINDSLGHEVGDMLLVSIAKRLKANLRSGDTASHFGEGHVPARLGGDEFVILLDGITDCAAVTVVAERLQAALSAPHQIRSHSVISTASIGIVTSDGHYDRAEDVLRDADTAMYRAKSTGKARHVVFDERMHDEAVKRLNMEEELRHAVADEAFTLEYQPIVALTTGHLLGFEALMRWNHAERGEIRPVEFIGLAEEIGLILPMGEWALRQASAQLKRWQDRFQMDPPLTMNVNLSKHQLRQGDLVQTVKGILDDTGLEASTLKLEVTESVIMDSPQRITNVLQALEKLGVKLCMDDFGTGHSSLSCLHAFPIEVLKIDRSFVVSGDENREYAAVIHAIVTLAHTLGMSVVGEGVEHAGQVAQLQALECDCAQGNFFSRPMTADAAEAFLKGPRGLRKSA